MQLLKELIRLSSQHRTLYCYSILSIWIFLLIAGMYKYIGTNNPTAYMMSAAKQYASTFAQHTSNNKVDAATRIKKYQLDCNPIESIVRKDDGGLLEGWHLQGVLLLTRHGDRGPMAHVRGINAVDCGHENMAAIHKYKTFLANTSTTAAAGGTIPGIGGHASWTKMGPFHGSPLLPAYAKSCLLGQLTYKGIGQLLQIGEIVRQVYGHPLGLLAKPIAQPPATKAAAPNATAPPAYNAEEIIIYSTRYRRTFQSAMALMFAFVPTERWQSLSVRESHSLAFCFADCACAQAINLKNDLQKEAIALLAQHPAIAAVVQWVGTSLLQNPSSQMQPMEVRDAVLSILCHQAPLPCKRPVYGAEQAALPLPHSTTADPSDFINIDQDDIVVSGGNVLDKIQPEPVAVSGLGDPIEAEAELDGCIEASHVAALMSYTNWQGQTESRHRYTRQQGILRAYGLIRNIVGYMLKMVSGDKTKFVLYSGHDRTMQFLMAALGIQNAGYFVPYAARMAFEVYRSEKDVEYYFRLVYNGKDVTREIDVCEGGKSLTVSKDSRGNKADLCPIENIIRFIHDDYFGPLNATNFKDACTVPKKPDQR